MSSLLVRSVPGFMFPRASTPVLKINQFHLLVVLFLGPPPHPCFLLGQFPQSHMAAEGRKAMSCIFSPWQKGLRCPGCPWMHEIQACLERPSVCQRALNGRRMKQALFWQRNVHCLHASWQPMSPAHTCIQFLFIWFGAEIPLARWMTYGWRKKCVAGQERHHGAVLHSFLVFVSQDTRITTKIVPIEFQRVQNSHSEDTIHHVTSPSPNLTDLFSVSVTENISQSSDNILTITYLGYRFCGGKATPSDAQSLLLAMH